jgi:hypothetical protein
MSSGSAVISSSKGTRALSRFSLGIPCLVHQLRCAREIADSNAEGNNQTLNVRLIYGRAGDLPEPSWHRHGGGANPLAFLAEVHLPSFERSRPWGRPGGGFGIFFLAAPPVIPRRAC